jgi:hypothetical protein
VQLLRGARERLCGDARLLSGGRDLLDGRRGLLGDERDLVDFDRGAAMPMPASSARTSAISVSVRKER